MNRYARLGRSGSAMMRAMPQSAPLRRLGLAGAVLLAVVPHLGAQERSSELTLRNVTGEPVTYRIGPASGDSGEVTEHTLAPDAIDRYSPEVARRVWFNKGARIVAYRVEPGRPYSFRPDENYELDLYEGSHGREDVPDLAPWVPTPMDVAVEMLEFAGVAAADHVIDLGCGDGRIVIAAASQFGARGVGVDIDADLIRDAEEAARRAGVEDRVEFRVEDATQTDVSSATLLGLYLLEESLEVLRPNLERQLRPGSRVVSLNYQVPGWEPDETREISSGGQAFVIYLYRR